MLFAGFNLFTGHLTLLGIVYLLFRRSRARRPEGPAMDAARK